MNYQDLLIQLDAGAKGTFTARVARSPAGESDPEPFVPPMVPAEVDSLGEAMGRAARDLQPVVAADRRETMLAEVGERLFRALFTGTVMSRYHESRGRVLARGDCGLRLRIEMGLKNPAMMRLHALPWEYLRSSEDGHFLGLRRDLSIVRYLDLALGGERPPVPAPLAILVVAGEDPAGSSLALQREHRAMTEAWGRRGAVHVDLLRGATLESLREALLARDYHVLHFMGHGGFDRQAGEGALAFRDEDRQRIWISAVQLGEQLRDRASLRLVFLNACWTARAISSGPYAGVATALLGAGVPAVLAMQFAVSDPAALAFSRGFYRRLALGDAIDEAVTEGRMAIRRLRPALGEWGTPALFQRLESGRLVTETVRPRARRSAIATGTSTLLAAALAAWWGWQAQQAPSPGAAQPAAGADGRPPVAQAGPRPSAQDNAPASPVGRSDVHEVTRWQHEEQTAHPALLPRTPRSHAPTDAAGRQRTPPAVPGAHVLADHQVLFLREVASWVSVEFSQLGQEPFVTLHVTRTGAPSINQAILGPTDVDLGAGKGRLMVQSIDWNGATLTLTAVAAAQ